MVLLKVNVFFLLLATVALCQSGNPASLDGAEDIVVKINSTVGNDSDCCNLGEHPMLCHSIDCVVTITASFTGSLTVYLESFQAFVLTKPIVFQHFESVRLNGSQATITCNDSSAGIAFFHVGNVVVEGLSIYGCGIVNSTKYASLDSSEVRAAVLISGCTNVTLKNTKISNSSGAGLFISNTSGGLISASHSNFSHNANDEHFSYTGGNGVLFLIVNNRKPTAVEFKSCDFVGNTASGPRVFKFLRVQGRVVNGYGIGGGMNVIVQNSSSHVTFNVAKCRFMKNLAFTGGGVSVVVGQESSLFILQIEESVFDSNGCTSNDVGSGGGAHFGMHGSTGEVGGNHFYLRELNFTNNSATVGGGTTFSSSRDTNPHSNNTIIVSECRWVGNTGHIGSAVDMSPHVADRLANGIFPFFEFSGCSFLNNMVRVERQSSQYALGIGTFFSSITNIKFNSTTLFRNNHGTALMLVNANADFSSADVTFIRNRALYGGAIALIGVSSMLVGPDKKYNFTENTARDRGGAIYVETIDEHDIILSRSCFLHYLSGNTEVPANEWTATFFFQGNRAPDTGHSIFITSLLPCSYKVSSNTAAGTWALDEIFRWPGVFSYVETEHQIATDGSQVSQISAVSKQPLSIIPGEEYDLAIVVLDELNQTATNTFRVSLDNNNIQVDRRFSYVISGIVQLGGQPGTNSTLLLETVSATRISVSFDIILATCPPGLDLTSQNKCECVADSYGPLLGCQHLQANITNGFWIGYINNSAGDSLLATGLCPREFCLYNDSNELSFMLPKNVSELNEFLCDPRRTGVLCGKCVAEYTVFFNSPNYNCHRALLCSVGWLFYIFSEIIPITLLFVLILAFDINFTSGAISSFILFSQLLDAMLIDGSGAIKWTDAVRSASWGYNLIYGIFRLNFFNIEPLSFCLFKDATALDILAFDFVSIGYAFSLILAAVLYLRYCGYRLGRFIRITTIQNSVIHGLAAFIIVSYAQGIYISLYILLPQTFRGANNDQIYPKRVWLNGEVEIFSREHLPYAIPAVLFLVTFGLFPPLILLFYPSLNRLLACCTWDKSRSFISIKKRLPQLFPSKFKPFLDSFQGYFKGNLRFFAGLYFFYRWIFITINAFSVTLGRFYFSMEIVLVIILLIHAIVQPYKVRWHNIVDTLLFADLLIINTFTGSNYYYSRSTEQQFNTQFIAFLSYAQLVFIYLPLVYFFCLLLVTIYSKCKACMTQRTRSSSKLSENLTKLKQRLTLSGSTTELDELPSRIFAEDTDFDDDYCDCSSLDVETVHYDTRQRINEGIF